MTRRLLPLMLLLACAGPVQAQGWYDIGAVFISEPIALTGPSSTTWSVTMPLYAIPYPPVLKHCYYWSTHGRPDLWDGVFPVFDQDIAFYPSGVNYTLEGGTFTVTVGDRRAGRTQTFCPRWPYRIVPVEEYEHLRRAE